MFIYFLYRSREQERNDSRIPRSPLHLREVQDRDLHRAHQGPEIPQHHLPHPGPRPLLQKQPRTLPGAPDRTRR